jgi:NADH-quinone oxidoreductase subunit N
MWHDLALTAPLSITIVVGLIALLTGAFGAPGTSRGWVGHLTSVGYALALVWTVLKLGAGPEALAFTTQQFQNSFTLDHFALVLVAVILVGALLMSLASTHYLAAQRTDHGEFYALIAFATSGMIALVMAADLLTIFVAVELMSIPLYILAGFKRESAYSTESAMKYFILGSFASAMLLMGMALTYGATGDLSLAAIGAQLTSAAATNDLASLGMLLMLAGFLFKVGAAPMHMWTPDVYEGAPVTATGFMAVAVKTASFGILARVLLTAFGADHLRFGATGWELMLSVVAVASMFVGNLSALNQRNLKRVLAWSAIAHTGYLLVAFVAMPTSDGVATNALGAGMGFYLLAYTLANAAAFGVAAAISGDDREDLDESAYAGLAKRSPGLAFALTVAILSLLGIPLTAGFIGKLTIFDEVLTSRNNDYLWLVIVAVVNSIISAFYYLRILLVAFMKDEDASNPIRLIESRPLGWAVGLAVLGTLGFGVLPSASLDRSKAAGLSLARTTSPSAYEPVENAPDGDGAAPSGDGDDDGSEAPAARGHEGAEGHGHDHHGHDHGPGHDHAH